MPVHDWTRVSPNIFHDFHTAWLSEIRKVLNGGVLPANYLAALEQSTGDAIPDVLALEIGGSNRQGVPAGDPGSAVAVEEAPPHVELVADVELFPVRQKHISIQHASRNVVALIELVSPGNKRSFRSVGQFVQKVTGALGQGLHVLVLDILPPRRHDPQGVHGEIWSELGGDDFVLTAPRPLILASYEAGSSVKTYVQTHAVGDSLRPMPLFLRRGWYVEVPLEDAYQEAWAGTPHQWRELLTASGEAAGSQSRPTARS